MCTVKIEIGLGYKSSQFQVQLQQKWTQVQTRVLQVWTSPYPEAYTIVQEVNKNLFGIISHRVRRLAEVLDGVGGDILNIVVYARHLSTLLSSREGTFPTSSCRHSMGLYLAHYRKNSYGVFTSFLNIIRFCNRVFLPVNPQAYRKIYVHCREIVHNLNFSWVTNTMRWFSVCGAPQLNCCGAVGPQDYKFSEWFNRTREREALFVPASCCLLRNDDPRNPDVVNEDVCQINAIGFLFDNSDLNKTQLKTRVGNSCCSLRRL